jgi:hypothetical protein
MKTTINEQPKGEQAPGENAVHADSFGHIIPGVCQPRR